MGHRWKPSTCSLFIYLVVFLVSVVSVASVASVAFALVARPEKLTQEFCYGIEALYHGSDPWCLQFSLAVLNQSPDGVAPFNV